MQLTVHCTTIGAHLMLWWKCKTMRKVLFNERRYVMGWEVQWTVKVDKLIALILLHCRVRERAIHYRSEDGEGKRQVSRPWDTSSSSLSSEAGFDYLNCQYLWNVMVRWGFGWWVDTVCGCGWGLGGFYEGVAASAEGRHVVRIASDNPTNRPTLTKRLSSFSISFQFSAQPRSG